MAISYRSMLLMGSYKLSDPSPAAIGKRAWAADTMAGSLANVRRYPPEAFELARENQVKNFD